jgi:predicted nucleotidyltransferase component of viral defense system
MLPAQEIAVVAEKFGVAATQVRRDHLISLLLALLSRDVAEDVLFFGGTALARTHLPDGRLGEDIDLIVRSERSRTVVATTIDALFAATVGPP